MAEYGTHHITSGTERPTIFEVLGQENLVPVLRSGFGHMFKVLAQNYPERFSLLHRYFDEGYTVVDSVFQYIHLRLKGGLFTETFYSLKRVPDPRSPSVSKRKVLLWTFLAVVFPYLRNQLENLFRKLREKKATGNLNYFGLQQELAHLYLKVYPSLHFLWESTLLGYFIAYALEKTNFHSPLLHLCSTRLAPLTSEDLVGDVWKQSIPNSERRSSSTLLWNWLNSAVTGVTYGISAGAFFMQFLDWWYSREDEGKNTFFPHPIPPPPMKWPCDTPIDICPICLKKRTNDTAISSSGFVFCYPCIFRYVQENHKCPVTGYTTKLGQLVKLYDMG